MFRISKQLEISRLIHECETVTQLCEWFSVIVNQIGVEEGRKITSNAFLAFKSRFDDQFIDQLLSSGPPSLEFDTNQVYTNDTKRGRSKQVETRCRLESLPNGVFNNISFYLSIKSSLMFSLTSHSFHKKIQNNQFFCSNRLRLLHKKGKKTLLILEPTLLNTITKNNCIMQCMHKSTKIDIKTVNDIPYSNVDCTNCPLSCLIDQITSDKNNTINYDLLWFKTIWGNMTNIYFSNHYRCALRHIPISWIFEQDKNQVSKPITIETFGAAPRTTTTRRMHMNQSVIDNFTKCVKNYVNDNPDKKIRKVQRIWYDRYSFDMIPIFESLGDSLTGVMLHLPRVWDSLCRFEQLDTFFKVFHKNLKWLEIHVDRDGIGDGGIISQLFKNNKQLCHDLNKSEKELSFNQFLKKYNCENKCLATIEHMIIDVSKLVPYQKSALFMLLNNDKIVQLMNLQQSVKYLRMTFRGINQVLKHQKDIDRLHGLAISKLDNMIECGYKLRVINPINEQEMKEFFSLANECLLQMAMKSKMKRVWMEINTKGWTRAKTLKQKIKIENQNELLYSNRDLLKRKISSVVDDSVQAVKTFLRKKGLVRIKQVFEFERDYSM